MKIDDDPCSRDANNHDGLPPAADSWLTAGPLVGEKISLVPLSLSHAEDLQVAVRDGELWKLWYTNAPKPEGVVDDIRRRIELRQAGTGLQFAIIDQVANKAIGMTGYLNAPSGIRRVEIGGTWLATSAQRTGINIECKILLLRHAFEDLRCIAVEFRTSFFNSQSRRAIEGLGAKLDGILRNHYDGFFNTRDTCVFSVIDSEWPNVERHLKWRLERYSQVLTGGSQ